jgi:hypothetical protein
VNGLTYDHNNLAYFNTLVFVFVLAQAKTLHRPDRVARAASAKVFFRAGSKNRERSA